MAAVINPQVFLDISIDGERLGRFVIELFNDKYPRTCENFRLLCTGEKGIGKKGFPLHFKGCTFHRVIRDFMLQGGDFTNHDGTGGESIYGEKFEDEGFDYKHDCKGMLSMANSGPNTNGSQFFITATATPHLDGKHVVFGKVIQGIRLVDILQEVETENDKPIKDVKIEDCGEIIEESSENDESGDIYPQFPEDFKSQILKDISISEFKEVLEKIKESGNDFYKKRLFDDAIFKYTKCCVYLKYYLEGKSVLEDYSTLHDVEVCARLNRALCYTTLSRFVQSIEDCSEVLEKEPEHVKALYRRGRSQHLINEFDSAKKDLLKAHKLCPSDQKVKNELTTVLAKIKSHKEKERQKYSKLFA